NFLQASTSAGDLTSFAAFSQFGSFYGRLRHFLDVIDPRTLFVSEVSKSLLKCKPQMMISASRCDKCAGKFGAH
uniref:Uncharacterized protein n=1 Tax=Sinocyclocheilus rhinocerous TaxID=307959 RepID=A0A673FXH2_9TELE